MAQGGRQGAAKGLAFGRLAGIRTRVAVVETVVVSLDRYNGHDLVDVRSFVAYEDGEAPKATKKGVSIKVGLLPELIAALRAAEAEARARGLITDGGAP